ncbi:MAG: hypothetical protein Ta2A_16860 [Treponemataceae bacterium]|nr:MAG: hypothetical protein Ta2A_16860 [Treponemataceae bacterium]
MHFFFKISKKTLKSFFLTPIIKYQGETVLANLIWEERPRQTNYTSLEDKEITGELVKNPSL